MYILQRKRKPNSSSEYSKTATFPPKFPDFSKFFSPPEVRNFLLRFSARRRENSIFCFVKVPVFWASLIKILLRPGIKSAKITTLSNFFLGWGRGKGRKNFGFYFVLFYCVPIFEGAYFLKKSTLLLFQFLFTIVTMDRASCGWKRKKEKKIRIYRTVLII